MSKKEVPAYITEKEIFPSRLREIMELRGTNQTRLVAKIKDDFGITIQRQSISKYMNGQTKPDTDTITTICKALDVSADYLLGLTDKATSDINERAICDYTGLSVKSLRSWRSMIFPAKEIETLSYSQTEFVNELICNPDFMCSLVSFCNFISEMRNNTEAHSVLDYTSEEYAELDKIEEMLKKYGLDTECIVYASRTRAIGEAFHMHSILSNIIEKSYADATEYSESAWDEVIQKARERIENEEAQNGIDQTADN